MEQSWLSALRTAAFVLLAYDTARQLREVFRDAQSGFEALTSSAADLTLLSLGVYALVAVKRGYFRRALSAATLTFAGAIAVVATGFPFDTANAVQATALESWSYIVESAQPRTAVAICLLIPLVRRRATRELARMPRYLPLAVIALIALERYVHPITMLDWSVTTMALLGAVAVAVAIWSVADERVALTLSVLLLAEFAWQSMIALLRGWGISVFDLTQLAAPAVLLLAFGAIRARREARV